jgi:hypothetical protein
MEVAIKIQNVVISEAKRFECDDGSCGDHDLAKSTWVTNLIWCYIELIS